jgi:hypothetical protein
MAGLWLAVPLEDYEGHMGPGGVCQLAVLADLFERALECCRPESVAVLGVAGGNGLDRIDCGITKRIVGVDLNPRYLEEVQRRFGSRVDGLELHCCDLGGGDLRLGSPVELVHAALIFEHIGLGVTVENALSLVAPGGRFSVVLQLPSESEPGVAATGYASIQALKRDFALIDAGEFVQLVAGKGFRLLEEEKRSLPGGKGLWLGVFARCQGVETGC